MKYSDLNLHINQDIIIAGKDDTEIEVLSYLPIEDKIDLIDIVLQNSLENGLYNELKIDMYFNLYLIYMYTNLEFTDEERADEYKLYNELESNGIITSVIGAIEEYDTLFHYLNVAKENRMKYNNSFAGIFSMFVQDMPRNAEAMSEIVDNFDKEKYKEVIDFARYANGGRPITNNSNNSIRTKKIKQ